MQIRILLSLIVFFSLSAAAANFYVSPSGSNSNPGTQALPWLTIQYSIDQLEPGDYLFVGDGIYNEKVAFHNSGTPTDYITLLASADAVLDGTGITSENAMVAIIDHSYIRIQGLEICNNIMNDAQGILVDGNCQGIQIVDNHLHDIHFSADAGEIADETKNAQGIIVFGSSLTPVSGLLIESNQLRNCRLGYSEGIAVNGNVDGFTVTQNSVHDLSNIGIVAIGHEGTCSDPVLDQARNGIITRNTVMNCHSPYAYCGGIYIDGAKSIAVLRNNSHNNDYGIEVGCEHHGKTASEITVRNNIVYENNAGIVVGGYDPEEAGSVINVSVFNNDIQRNNAGGEMSEIVLSVAENTVFSNNIIIPLADKPAVTAAFPITGVLFDYNLYYTLSGNSTMLVETTEDAYTFAEFQQTGQEMHGLFADPLCAPLSPCIPENMGPASPARNAGDPNYTLFPGELDFWGNSRIQENRVDIGAAEFPVDLGVSELSENLFTIFPNPAGDRLFIQTEEIVSSVVITDFNGKILMQVTNDFHLPINLNGLPEGIYLITIGTVNGRSTGRFVKQ